MRRLRPMTKEQAENLYRHVAEWVGFSHYDKLSARAFVYLIEKVLQAGGAGWSPSAFRDQMAESSLIEEFEDLFRARRAAKLRHEQEPALAHDPDNSPQGAK